MTWTNSERPSTTLSQSHSLRTRLEFKPRTVVIASILAAGLIAAVGAVSDICLGDENPHVRHVQAYVAYGKRIPYDPASALDSRAPLALSGTPLWHAGLAVLWKLTGTESQVLAQSYHAGFYLLGVLSVYFAARRVWDTAAASWAWLLIATMPMVCAYSILLFQDVPGVAVSALALLLLWRKNFLACGIALAAGYFTKMNMLAFAPWAVVFAAWTAGGSWKQRIASALLVAAPVAAVFTYDMMWRMNTYGNMTGWGLFFPKNIPSLSDSAKTALVAKPKHYVLWQPFTIDQPKAYVTHIGIPVLCAMFVGMVRSWDTVSKWLWACLALAVAGFIWIFALPGWGQVRYLMPAMLIVVLLCGRGLQAWRPSAWMKSVVIGVCVLQAAVTCTYIYYRRQIPVEDKQGFEWIRQNTNTKSRIMFPEQLLINQTGRPYIWWQLNPAYFMTEASDRQRQELLGYFHVSHIAIPLRRVYDRKKEGDHWGGYPQDFVEKAHSLPYLEKVYENQGFLIFKFIPSKAAPSSRPAGP